MNIILIFLFFGLSLSVLIAVPYVPSILTLNFRNCSSPIVAGCILWAEYYRGNSPRLFLTLPSLRNSPFFIHPLCCLSSSNTIPGHLRHLKTHNPASLWSRNG
ncbi:hypothetical protein C8R42DRAFT_375195 [Lentinula raphanica]|nr:hypothetical protein C8R42DRAFT_690920 [Lentinula raphanica]KAJ3710555.1 hypothetical protein C8R42DRAFT_375195 [Lentinula raphanica]